MIPGHSPLTGHRPARQPFAGVNTWVETPGSGRIVMAPLMLDPGLPNPFVLAPCVLAPCVLAPCVLAPFWSDRKASSRAASYAFSSMGDVRVRRWSCFAGPRTAASPRLSIGPVA